MAPPLVQFQGVGKRFGTHWAVDDIQLSIATGSATALVGESGSGKSTLLRLVAGLIDADRGSLRVFGQPLAPETVSGVRVRIGYMIQEGGLFPHLSSADNAMLAAEAIGWSARRRKRRLEELVELTRLDPALLKSRPGQLSGGQRQRIALIRALFLDPELLLLDEPLGALDPVIRSQLQDELRSLFDRLGKTVVLVTHDLPEAAFFSDDLVLMNGGRIVQRGSFEDLRDHPADEYVSRFVAAVRPLPS